MKKLLMMAIATTMLLFTGCGTDEDKDVIEEKAYVWYYSTDLENPIMYKDYDNGNLYTFIPNVYDWQYEGTYTVDDSVLTETTYNEFNELITITYTYVCLLSIINSGKAYQVFDGSDGLQYYIHSLKDNTVGSIN